MIFASRLNGMKRSKLGFYCIFVLFFAGLLYGDWEFKAPLNIPRGGLVCEVVNDKIYAITGRQQMDILTRVCEEYDPQLDSWTFKTSIPTARYGAISGVVGNKIYVIGGDTNTNFSRSSATNVIESYDPIRDTWETVNSVWPFPRSGAAGTVVGDWIYIMGGLITLGHQNIYFDTVEAYNPILNQWVVKRSMRTPRAYFDAAASENKIYAMAGQFYNSIKLCEVYDTITNTWDSIRSLPRSRYLFASVALENKIFVTGGLEGFGFVLSGSVYYYDPSIGEWDPYDSLNQARYRHGSVVIGNDIYVIGGKDTMRMNNYLRTVEKSTVVGIEEENDTISEIITKNIPTFLPADKPFVLNKNWQLFDASGRKVNPINLNRGLYFLLIKEEEVKVKKIIIY
jgi:N-acetylneuraminic acid mutarotase